VVSVLNMVKGIILVAVGLTSTVVLAFASLHSESKVVRVLFWTALFAAAGVIVYSGIETIRSDWAVHALEQRLRPRELSAADVSEIAGTLRAAGSFKVHMIRGSGEAEAARLADQLKAAFVQAGWTVEKNLVDLTGTPRFGLNIKPSKTVNVPPNVLRKRRDQVSGNGRFFVRRGELYRSFRTVLGTDSLASSWALTFLIFESCSLRRALSPAMVASKSFR